MVDVIFTNNKQSQCAVCGTNGSVKKWTYYFSYNRKTKVCVRCASSFNSNAEITAWLEANAIYNTPNGKLIGFRRTENG